MISCVLNGGLGNQLWQIAAAYSLAKAHGDECAFDFSLVPMHQGKPAMKYRDNLYAQLKDLPKGWKPEVVYVEKGYDYHYIPYHKNMLLKGYFQRDKYFARHRNEIKALFNHVETLSRLVDTWGSLLGESLSVHVRRGDFVKKFPHVYVELGMDYYDRAIDFIDDVEDIRHILVFSDDIPWCKENFKDNRVVFIEGQKDYEDLLLMSLCTANIIANSSFSKMAAILGETPMKFVVAPSRWFKNDEMNQEINPQRWIVI